MRPKIGLNGGLEQRGVWRVDLPLRYADAVRSAGGLPVGLYPTTDADEIREQLEHLDGLVLTGGDDFDTGRMGLRPTHAAATPVPTLKQDADLALARAALELGIPVLGICYGMQLLALAAGGQLYQHLPDDRPQAREHGGDSIHTIRATPGTKLAEALGVEPVPVVSRHHQAIASVAGGWRVAATDDQGLIEGVELEGHPFAIGAQWHPELSAREPNSTTQDGPNARLLQALVRAARECASAATI